MLDLGLGLTNLVARATSAADELTPAELIRGGERLLRLARRIRPARVAFVGITAYRSAFRQPRAQFGPQPDTIGPAQIWVLPNPSGRNVSFSLDPFRQIREELGL